ncbi:hypothetical protein JCM11251_005981 [Rhodosporidiobolus azoricus]
MASTAHPYPAQDAEAALSQDGLDEKVSSDGSSTHSAEVHKTAGVLKMEAIGAMGKTPSGRWALYLIAGLIWIMYYVYQQQSSTTYAFNVFATSSFAQHASGLASMGIATGIIGAVILPFLAKLADVFSRPWLCVVSLIGYVISPTLAAYVIGNVFVAIGTAGLSLLASILAADLVPLQYRGFAQGLLSAPYIVIPWYSSYIASALSEGDKWRWGYGMYAIIMPAIFGPAILLLFWLQRKAAKHGVVVEKPSMPLGQRLILAWHELDGFGLLLMGFGWALILLPFPLSGTADGGYKNRSLIAMFVVGGVLLISYVFYELYWAKFPSSPRRILFNRTWASAACIDFVWMVAGYMNLTYLSSYVYVVTDMSVVEWGYYSNTLSVALCLGGVIAGVIMRFTHRYKLLQILGLSIKIIGYGLLVDKNGVHDTARLVSAQVLTGIGGSFAVVGSQVGSQASVPHQDVALAISLLSLWSKIGSGIGEAIAYSVWSNNMPRNLRTHVPASVNDTMIETFYGAITTIKALPYDDPVRQGCIKAYEQTVYPLWSGALGLSFVALIAACFQTNYYLGNTQNAYDHKDAAGEVIDGEKQEHVQYTGWRKWVRFWDL